jgi:hypothetical protein
MAICARAEVDLATPGSSCSAPRSWKSAACMTRLRRERPRTETGPIRDRTRPRPIHSSRVMPGDSLPADDYPVLGGRPASHDLSGPAKAVWFVVVLIIPLFGVLAYLIVRGGSMHERSARLAARQEDAYRAYIQQTASDSPGSTADQLSKLAGLRDQGDISAAEFEREKAKVLA